MEERRAYKFRIYPDAKCQSEIDEQIELARVYYNKLLEKAKIQYELHKFFAPPILGGYVKFKPTVFNLRRFDKEIKQEFPNFYAQTRDERRDAILRKLIYSYDNAFRRFQENSKKGKKGKHKQKLGFPRFKSRDKYKSVIICPRATMKGRLNGMRISRRDCRRDFEAGHAFIKFPIFSGKIDIELHRAIEGIIKSVTLKKEAGDYYAVFSTLKEIGPPKIEDTNPVGIDLGCRSKDNIQKNFAVFSKPIRIKNSDSTPPVEIIKLEKPKFLQRNDSKIAYWSRKIARQKKGSHRRQSSHRRQIAKEHLARAWKDSTNEANDWMQKRTTEIVNSKYTSFSLEGLDIPNMMKNHKNHKMTGEAHSTIRPQNSRSSQRGLHRSIANASWAEFRRMLEYKAESSGKSVYIVNPENTTQECSGCHNIKEAEDRIQLGETVYNCAKCGLEIDRDINAATNIMHRPHTQ